MKLNVLAWIPLVVAVIFFGVAAYFTRADRRHVLNALIGGALAGGIGLLLDVGGYLASLWYYLGAHVSHGPWLVYVAVGFAQGVVALIAWGLAQRFNNVGLVIFVFFVASVLTSQDYFIANSPYRIQIISPGIAPAIYDLLLWLTVTTVSVWTLRALSGSAWRKIGEPSGEEEAAH
jgi:hypothetical protein